MKILFLLLISFSVMASHVQKKLATVTNSPVGTENMSEIIDMTELDKATFQYAFTGTVTGNIKFYGTLYYPPNSSSSYWTEITAYTASGSATTGLLQSTFKRLTDLPYAYMKTSFTALTGTATYSSYIFGR